MGTWGELKVQQLFLFGIGFFISGKRMCFIGGYEEEFFFFFFPSVIVINMFCAIFGFVGLQSMTEIIFSRKDIEPNACCPGARLYVLSLGSCIILEKKQVLCYIPELLADFVR